MKIYWSNESIVKYESIIDNLIENWPITVAQDFEFLTNSLLDNLKLNKKFVLFQDIKNSGSVLFIRMYHSFTE